VALPSTETDAPVNMRRRAFDFGDDDELDDLVFDAPAPKDANGSMATKPHILAPALSSFGTEASITHSFGTEGSITPESQRSHTSRPQLQPRLNNREPLQLSAVSLQNKVFAPAPASIVARIWQKGASIVHEHRAEERAGCEVDRQGAIPASALGQSGQGSKDRLPEPREARKRQLGKVDRSCDSGMTLNRCQDDIDKRTVHSQSSMVNNCGYPQDTMFGSEPTHLFPSNRPQQGAGASDAWKERGRHGGREAPIFDTSADDHARHVLLSPLETSRVDLNSHISARSSGIDYIEGDEQDANDCAVAGGWGQASARAKGGLSRKSNVSGSNALVPNKFFADDGPRPCVPGPAGKLGRVEVGAGRSGGLSSPALQEQRDQDQNASREMREGAGGIAVDATGPHLPLRSTFLVVF
jgi:hypothetical protein